MIITVFDTETTGVPPRNQKPSAFNQQYWPHVVQFSYLQYDTEKNTYITKDHIVKIPEHKTIPQEAIDIHGITNEIMRDEGEDIKVILKEYIDMMEKTDIIVAHNLEFDYNIMMVELIRNKMISQLKENVVKFCTMDNTKKLCNIKAKSRKGTEYIKWPSLVELHIKLFDSEPDNLHNSLIDVFVCFRCYYKIRYKKDMFDQEINKTFYDEYKELCQM